MSRVERSIKIQETLGEPSAQRNTLSDICHTIHIAKIEGNLVEISERIYKLQQQIRFAFIHVTWQTRKRASRDHILSLIAAA